MIHYRIIIGNSIYDHLSSYPYSYWQQSRQFALDRRMPAQLQRRDVFQQQILMLLLTQILPIMAMS